MKKIFLFLSIFLVWSVVTDSCIYQKVIEEEYPGPGPRPDPGPGLEEEKDRTFRVNAFAPVTSSLETYASVDMSGNPPFYRWEPSGVHIGLYVKGEGGTSFLNNQDQSLSNNAGGTESTNIVTIKTADVNASAFAYYPYKSTVSGTICSSSLSSVQNQSTSWFYQEESLPNENLLFVAPSSESFILNGGSCNLYFKSIFAFLQFHIIKDNSLNMMEKAKSFKLYIADEHDLYTPLDYTLAGDYEIDVSKAPGTSGYTGPQFKEKKNMITAEFTDDGYYISNDENSVMVQLIVNPVEIKQNERFVVVLEGSGGSLTGIPFSMRSIERDKAYKFIIEANSSNTLLGNYTEEVFVNKPANSFVVTKRGRFQIEAKTAAGKVVKGEKVEWLWASKEGGPADFPIDDLINPGTIAYNETDNTIRFSAGGNHPFSEFKKGNVILALKDASNQIVWTWHIWITDAPQDIAYGGKKFLDRNIGALSTDTLSSVTDTYGFVYQWGRKDPFFGGDGLVYDESNSPLYTARMHTILNPSGVWGTDVKKWSQTDDRASDGNVDKAGKYPMMFISNKNSLSEQDPADWLSGSQPDLWSDDGKTDYDPCPYGYKVPAKSDFSLHSAYSNYLLYLEDIQQNPSEALPLIWFYNRNQSNRYWEYGNQGVTTVWPAAGMRQGRNISGKWIGAQLKYSGTDDEMGKGYYWTSTPLTVDGNIVPGSSFSIHWHNTVLYSTDRYGPNADAYPVRCIRMTTP